MGLVQAGCIGLCASFKYRRSQCPHNGLRLNGGDQYSMQVNGRIRQVGWVLPRQFDFRGKDSKMVPSGVN